MRTTHALALAGLLAVVGSPAVAQKQKKVAQKEISRELREMEEEEQREQQNWESMSEEEFGAAQVRRRNRTREIVDAGWLDKTADFTNAGMLLQHGQEPDDYLLAHILGTVAALDGDAGGKFLSAAALDRFLMSVGQPQYFTSQYGDEEGKQPVEPFDDTLSQVVVSVFGEPSRWGGLRGREVDPANRKKKELKAASKELKKLALAKRSHSTKDENYNSAQACEVVLSYVIEGKLDGPDDLMNAAVVLFTSEGERHHTLAHILATAAAIEGHKPARALFVSTLDRLLVDLERPPVFDSTETEEDALVLHANVKQPFLAKKRR